MRDSQYEGRTQQESDTVSLVAAQALARLVARDGKPTGALSVTVLEMVTQAFVSPDADAMARLRSDLRRNRVSNIHLADLYLPQIARNLGVDWEMDRISFASLSIAVARMQAFLRDIGGGWTGDIDNADGNSTVLLVVPKGEAHTLGPMTLLGQLRRRGISVNLCIAPTAEQLRMQLQQHSFDGAIMSVACGDFLEQCRMLVETLKAATGGKLQVALGGAVLLTKTGELAPTGADIVTNDLDLALAAFGVAVPENALHPEHG